MRMLYFELGKASAVHTAFSLLVTRFGALTLHHLKAIYELVGVVARKNHRAFRWNVFCSYNFDAPKENRENRVQKHAHRVEKDRGCIVGHCV